VSPVARNRNYLVLKSRSKGFLFSTHPLDVLAGQHLVQGAENSKRLTAGQLLTFGQGGLLTALLQGSAAQQLQEVI